MPAEILYTDTELIALLRTGSQDGFRQLFTRLIRPLVYFATELTGSSQEGEDIAGNAFHKLWERHASFATIGDVRGFLYTTVRNECLNVLRHKKVKQRAQNELMLRLEQEPQWTEARKVHAELLQLIYAEINNLPAHHKEMVLMSFVEELSTEEIAARLNISPAHVRTNKARAIAQLRNALLKKGLLKASILLLMLKF